MTDARDPRALRIGVTGPIGCGKSTVAGWLAERRGVVAIDADLVARDVLAPGTAESAAVFERFGESVRTPDGSLDRAALGRVVFADPAALHDLERIVHPAVRPRILEAIDAAERDVAVAVVIEAIKLVEGGLAELCDEVWLVTCDPAVQLERVTDRGAPETDARERIEAQGDLTARLLARADRVIETDDAPAVTRRGVESALDEALSRRGEARTSRRSAASRPGVP